MAQLSFIVCPIIVSILLTITLYFLFKKLVKDKIKAAIIVSTFITVFFLFGLILHLFPCSYIIVGGMTITNYHGLIVLWADVVLLTTLIILKTRRNLNFLNGYLNTAAIFLILLPSVNIGIYEFKAKRNLENLKSEPYNFSKNNSKKLPDIYYIIFDGYAREDILKEIYGYDNSSFIDYLTQKGFYVARQSRANYPQTYLSMASCLNFEYVNYLSETVGEGSNDRRMLSRLIEKSKTYQILRNRGYFFISVPGTWYERKLYTDMHMHLKKERLSDFGNALINITPLGVFFGKTIQLNSKRERIIFSFEHIPDIAKINSPTFIYAHFLLPHPPFIFDKDGMPITPKGLVIEKDGSHYFRKNPNRAEYRKKYKDQLIFVNKKAREMIDEILERSDMPPIIILQSDHGPGLYTVWEDPEKTNMKERLSIFNAYYLPEEGKKLLYESITPVNTFRVIFNYLFNADLEILNDKSYFSTWDHPYKFIDITKAPEAHQQLPFSSLKK